MTTTDRRGLIQERALASLRDELRLQAALARKEWVSIHSHHFFDLREQQWRELDAVASRMWSGYLAKNPIKIKVVFLVESKSLAEKHLLLPAHKLLKQAIVFDWLGSSRWRNERFIIYEEAGLDRRLATTIDTALTGGAADVMPNAPNILLPPRKSIWHATGLVEARNQAGKAKKSDDELGSSVVWRARLALQSAAQALAHNEIESAARDLRLAIQFARLRQISRQEDPTFDIGAQIAAEVAKNPFTITIFHPVVVVDADIWGVNEDDVTPVEHTRVHLTGISRYPYFWFDLVKRERVESVVRDAQASYDKQAEDHGLSGVDVSLGTAEYEIAHP